MIEKIKYEKLFPTGMYLNEKIGFEMGIEEMSDENVLEVIEELRELAERSHKEKYPHLYTSNGKPITIEQVPEQTIRRETKETATLRMVQAIQDCIVLDDGNGNGLYSFRKLAESNQEIKEVYDRKLQSLQNKNL